jgi:hypothetical protein
MAISVKQPFLNKKIYIQKGKKMKLINYIFICIISICSTVYANTAAAANAEKAINAANLPLTDVIKLQDLTIPFHKSEKLILPPLPTKPGKIIILSFKAVSKGKRTGGCNWNATVKLNNTPLGLFTTTGTKRLIGRSSMFTLNEKALRSFPVFGGKRLDLIGAPNTKAGDRVTTDNLGASFALDISDIARGVDGNTLTFTNIQIKSKDIKQIKLLVTDLRIGWLDSNLIPKEKSKIPKRGSISKQVAVGKLTLSQGANGGFMLATDNGLEIRIETAIGMNGKMPSALTTDDVKDKLHTAYIING